MVRFGAALVVLAGCLEADLVLCGDGRACPQGTTCLDALQTCVTSEQLAACEGVEPGTACSFAVSTGTCIEGACFEARCGDRIVEPGEACDDGNTRAGDGCAANCATAEQCGDGVLETLLGEQCDDGNLVSGDGCDSACSDEQIVVKVRHCGEPAAVERELTTFDVARNRLVTLSSGWMYEWDGTSWSCTWLDIVQEEIVIGAFALVYDPTTERVLGFFNNGVHAWDGTALTLISPEVHYIDTIAYDSSIQEFFLYNQSGEVRYWNPTTFAVTQVPDSLGPTSSSYTVTAYDAQADRMIAVNGPSNAPLDTWVWDRSTSQWTQSAASLPVYYDAALAYYPPLGKVVEFGGGTGAGPSATVYSWSGTTWEEHAPSTDPLLARTSHGLVYTPAPPSLLVIGGGPDVLRFDGAWTRSSLPSRIPAGVTALVSFPTQRSLIAVTSTGATWRTTTGGDWTAVPTSALAPSVVTYHPGLDRVVGYDSTGRLAAFDGVEWTTLAMDASPIAPRSLAYDHGLETLMAYDNQYTFVRDATGWQSIGLTVIGSLPSLGYDARRAQMTVSIRRSISFASVLRLEASGWQQVFTFPTSSMTSPPHAAFEAPQRGNVWYASRTDGIVWEGEDNSWRRFEGTRLGNFDVGAFDVPAAELVLIHGSSGRVIGVGYSSGAPRESCLDGEDVDADGAAGCDDDDCFWRCAPTCPPYSSCF